MERGGAAKNITMKITTTKFVPEEIEISLPAYRMSEKKYFKIYEDENGQVRVINVFDYSAPLISVMNLHNELQFDECQPSIFYEKLAGALQLLSDIAGLEPVVLNVYRAQVAEDCKDDCRPSREESELAIEMDYRSRQMGSI